LTLPEDKELSTIPPQLITVRFESIFRLSFRPILFVPMAPRLCEGVVINAPVSARELTDGDFRHIPRFNFAVAQTPFGARQEGERITTQQTTLDEGLTPATTFDTLFTVVLSTVEYALPVTTWQAPSGKVGFAIFRGSTGHHALQCHQGFHEWIHEHQGINQA
jgi:hypothetical protein